MGVYRAINSAVSGLTAQARALENISGNVANSQTVGYRRLDTTFSDLVSRGGAKQGSQVAGTTYATSRATNRVTGDISSSQIDTHMAIRGDGYFVVGRASGVTDGSTVFKDGSFYTRAGDFEVDREGYFVNSAGYHLKGFPLDVDTGNAVGDVASVIKVDTQPLAAQATTVVDYRANLPRIPNTADYDGSTSLTALLDASVSGDVDEAEVSAFLSSSISGGSVTVYNVNGTAVPLEIRFAKTVNGDGVFADRWSMYIGNGLGDASAIGTHYHYVGGVYFGMDGEISGISNGTIGYYYGFDGFTISGLEVAGVSMPDFNFLFADGSLTQYADPDGVTSSISLSQDGFAAGELNGITIDESGRIVARYSNNQMRAVYDIPLATFKADQELRRVDGAAFAATVGSGEPVLSGGGAVLSNAVELSNADIADEFAKLIITQQAYSANSRVVSSANDMLDSALNMIR